MQHRQDKINEEIKHVLAEVLRDMKDPRVSTMISVVGVDATKDLKQAKVYVSILGEEAQQNAAMKAIKTASGFIRHELGGKIDLHYTPELVFILDHSIEQGARIEELLKKK